MIELGRDVSLRRDGAGVGEPLLNESLSFLPILLLLFDHLLDGMGVS